MKIRLFVVLLFAFVLVWPSLAAGPDKASGIPDKDQQKVDLKIDKSKVSPELRPILEAEEVAVKQIGELKQRMKTLDGSQIAELQREIEKVKRNTEIQILKIRLQIAQKRNDTRNIQQIEKALYQLENPLPVVEDRESKVLREAQEREKREK